MNFSSASFSHLRWNKMVRGGLKLNISLPPGKLGTDKTPIGWALLFLTPWQNQREFFSSLHNGTLVMLLNVKLTEMWGLPVTGSFCSFDAQVESLFSTSSVTYNSGFSTLVLGFCCKKLKFSLFSCLFLQFWGRLFALWPHFSVEFKRSCLFFSLFNFYFLGWSDDFQAAYLPDQKLEVLFYLP